MAILAGTGFAPHLVLAVSDDVEPVASRTKNETITALYAEHGAHVHRFMCQMLRDATLAKDATQETFARAHQRLATFDPTLRVKPWLFGIAHYVLCELRKSRARAGRCFVLDNDADAPASGCPETSFLDREALAVVNATLAQLPEERRAMLLLRLDHGLAYDDIAVTMNCSLAKVKVEIHRAREALRAAKASYENGGAR